MIQKKKELSFYAKLRVYDDMHDVLNVASTPLSQLSTHSLKKLRKMGLRDLRRMVRQGTGPFARMSEFKRSCAFVWPGRIIAAAVDALLRERQK